jgi:hypothetical protein
MEPKQHCHHHHYGIRFWYGGITVTHAWLLATHHCNWLLPSPNSGVYFAGGGSGTWNQYGAITVTTNSIGSAGDDHALHALE